MAANTNTNTNPESKPNPNPSPPPPPSRHITTHSPSGSATFHPSPDLPPLLPPNSLPGMIFYDAYTLTHPITLTHEADIPPNLSPPPTNPPTNQNQPITFPRQGTTLLRYCDWPPSGSSPLHRHETIDFGIVISGTMEAVLDSGEKRVLRAGDVLVQRGTLHGWRNLSGTEWARVVFVIMGCEEGGVEVGGRRMGEELGGFVGGEGD